MIMKMTANDLELLGRFSREHSQDAFTALVKQYMDLVYSAALRQVRSPELAEEVCQTVFTQLARNAAKVKSDTVLSAWLYQVTRHAAIDVIRSEARRRAREQIAIQMSETNAPADWSQIEPLLDEAMQSLDQTDRTAILLRYFESKSLREVGEALGATEDAAQKRVARAVEQLRQFFLQRKIQVGAAALAALVSANAIQAAPTVLVATVAAGAVTAGTSTAIGITKFIAMTTMQKAIATVAAAALIGTIVYQARTVSHLREEVQNLTKQQEEQAGLSAKAQQLERERDRAKATLANLTSEEPSVHKGSNEVLKLRGEVGRLRQEKAQLGSSNALSKATATPEARKMLRDTQKLAMGMIYKGFAQEAKLTTEQADKLNDLLADHIMSNVDHTTTSLRDKLSSDQMNSVFSAQEAALEQQIESALGSEGLNQYREYTKNLLATLSAEQFKSMMTGTDAEKGQKAQQLRQLMQQQIQAALDQAGLPTDYQTVPMLNFANIASEQQGEKSLTLLADIFQRTAAEAGSFLSPAEIAKLQEFKNLALTNNRGALNMNRAIMAPISD